MPSCIEASISKLAFDIYEFMWGPNEFMITGTRKTYERGEDIGRIQIPTLLTCGRYDEASPDTTGYYLTG